MSLVVLLSSNNYLAGVVSVGVLAVIGYWLTVRRPQFALKA
jgi:hypothetical protein